MAELRARYEGLSNEALEQLLCSDEFTPEARAAARQVLAEREAGTLPTPPIKPVPEHEPVQDLEAAPPVGLARRIAGWLFVGVGAYLVYAIWEVWRHAHWSGLCILGGGACFAFGAAWRLWTRSGLALACALVAQVITTVGLVVAFDRRNAPSLVMPTIGISIVLALVWAFVAAAASARAGE